MWGQDGSGVYLPTLRKTRLQKQEMIIFSACRYVDIIICSVHLDTSPAFCPRASVLCSSSITAQCHLLSLSPMYQLLSLGPVKFCRKNPPCSHTKWPDYDVKDGMEHSGLHHHTAATALLYMWPLLLRAGEWRGLGATTGAECSQPLTLFPALCRVLQKHCSILLSPPPLNAATFGNMRTFFQFFVHHYAPP